MNFMNSIFIREDVKSACKLLDELEVEIASLQYSKLLQPLKKTMKQNPQAVTDGINLEGSVHAYVYNVIGSYCADELESGEHHLYRGILNPIGDGPEYMRIFELILKKLIHLKALTQEEADKIKSSVINNMSCVG